MNEIVNLIIQNKEVKKNAKANYFALLFSYRNQANNFSVVLPESVNSTTIEDICDHILEFSGLNKVSFNPTGTEEGTFEYVPYKQVEDTWNWMLGLINNAVPYKDKNRELVPKANLGVCEMQYKDKHFYVCSKQVALEKVLKGKPVFMSSDDKVIKVETKEMFMIRSEIDFIVFPPHESFEGEVYIFNRKSFISLFRYFEHLKKVVKENISVIEEWKFLESSDLIKQKVDQKNVFANLSKIFADEQYMEEIKSVRPSVLKKRLLEKSNGVFSESDFNGTKLLVTKQNLDKVMKALAKGFKYNFFADRAEEL